MDPVTIAMLASTGVSMLGNYLSSQQKAQAYEAKANQAEYNSAEALLTSQANADQYAIQARKAIGAEAAGYAGAGVAGGSVYSVMADSKTNAELDRLNIIFGGNLRSKEFSVQAAANRTAASNAKTSGILGMLSSGLGGATKIIKS